MAEPEFEFGPQGPLLKLRSPDGFQTKILDVNNHGDLIVSSPLPFGFIDGMKLSINQASPLVKIDITAGTASPDCAPGEGVNIVFNSLVTIDTGVSGAGGLDTGTVGNNLWYAVLVIGDTTNVNSQTAMFTLDPDSPTMPAGYDCCRRIGWIKTNNTAGLMRFIQRFNGKNRRYIWNSPVNSTSVLTNGTSDTYATIDMSSYVPVTSCFVVFQVDFMTGTSGTASDGVSFQVTGQTSTIRKMSTGKTSGQKAEMYMELPSNESQEIDYKVDDSTNNKVTLSVRGWDDEI